MNSFPNQTVSESKKKDKDWLKKHFDYADQLVRTAEPLNQKFTEQVQKFNGETTENRYSTFIKWKGKNTSRQYIDNRWHYAKLKVVNNEYLKRPLPTYVYSANQDVIKEKVDRQNTILGAYSNKKEIEHLRGLGVPMFEGMKIPENEDELKSALDIRTQNEKSFSIILKNAIDKYHMKLDFGRNNMHIIIGMRCFSKVELLSNGRVEHVVLDPRNEICEYHENDPLRKRTQIHGSILYMNPGEIVARYSKFLKKEEINRIYERARETDDLGPQSGKYYRISPLSKNFEFAVTHIEWKTKKKTYWKISEDKKDPDNPYRIEIKTDDWIKNEKKYREQEKSGKFKIEEETDDNIMEGVRIGEDIFCMMGYKKYCLPNKDFSYCSVQIDSYDGRTVSLIDLSDEINFMINIVSMQVKDTIRKYVGSAFVYDEAMLPENKDVVDVVYSLVEDGVIRHNSRATGNASQTNFESGHGITFITSPQLADIQQLIMLKADLKRDLDEITSINKERQGDTLASQTATAARQNMSQSRVMTYHLNLFSDIHAQRVLSKWCEYTRISHVYIKPLDRGDMLSELGLSSLKIDKSASYDRLGVQIANIEREIEVNDRLNNVFMPLAIQRDSVQLSDILSIEISETVNEKIQKLYQSMERAEKIKEQDAQRESEAQQKQIQAQNEGMQQLAEKQHQDDIEKIVVEGQVDGANKTLDAKNQLISERAKKIIEDNAAFDNQQNS